jgi:antitoxin component of MazEF toxin-antitoxin module
MGKIQKIGNSLYISIPSSYFEEGQEYDVQVESINGLDIKLSLKLKPNHKDKIEQLIFDMKANFCNNCKIKIKNCEECRVPEFADIIKRNSLISLSLEKNNRKNKND